ncbi:MAG: hypothetical protein ABIL39_09110 [candidate division WOR-3 bacterium]
MIIDNDAVLNYLFRKGYWNAELHNCAIVKLSNGNIVGQFSPPAGYFVDWINKERK